jgi:hypothetical protein
LNGTTAGTTGRCLALVFLLGGTASTLHSQATTSASRLADAQVGIGYLAAKPDYLQETFQGFAAYGDLDFRLHYGLEAEFHQANSTSGDQNYERTYEIGARYLRTYGPLIPYVKIMVGRGVFNYPNGVANLAYNMFAGGAGADLKLNDHLRVRGDLEYQRWSQFPNGGLMPRLVTVGVAYHFTGKPR